MKNMIYKIFFISLFVVNLSGCGEKQTEIINENHKRYDVSTKELINSFIKENLLINNYKIKNEYFILNLINNSDYYINGIKLGVYKNNNIMGTLDPIFMRPHSDITIFCTYTEKITNINELYLECFSSDFDSQLLPITLEEYANVVYSTDLKITKVKYSKFKNVVTLKVENKLNKNIVMKVNNCHVFSNATPENTKKVLLRANSSKEFGVSLVGKPQFKIKQCFFYGCLNQFEE